ncbi:unnamed protein product [Fraxinus pennsylvanica]|uniref:Uncharacterized protein n=1 Tax=Fraxinus pennsylvanica TaxID=56036 RepID=A0AAD2DXB2_9LAMI|nr:unnamed protein product [Fraxinus pennsylvanica]
MLCWKLSKKDQEKDWDGHDLNHINEERSSQVESQISKAKLVPRRANENSTSEVQQNPPTYRYIFMPKPGLRVTSDAQSNNNGHFPTVVRLVHQIDSTQSGASCLWLNAPE